MKLCAKIASVALFSLGLSAWGMASDLPLFGEVVGVGEHDVLVVRKDPRASALKVGAIPGDAPFGVGVDRQVVRGQRTWYHVYPLPPMGYDEFSEEKNSGWVNGKFLKGVNRGYVLVDGRGNCAYSLQGKGGQCEVVLDLDQDENGEVKRIYTQWIARNRLKGTSNFGAMGEDGEGYCVRGAQVSEFLKKNPPTSKKQELKTLVTKTFALTYPTALVAQKESDGGVSVIHEIPLEHVSGSDMRDNPEILKKRQLFHAKFQVFDSLKNALVSVFPEMAQKENEPKYRYDAKTDWFQPRKKGDPTTGMVNAEEFCEQASFGVVIGAEGAGIYYHFYKSDGKVVLVTEFFDQNPPLDPKTLRPLPGKWTYPDRKSFLQVMVDLLKVKP